MASAVAERVWRTSTPDAIEADLSALWREVGERGPIARAMMSNLVVFRRARPAARADAGIDELLGDIPVDAVAARHPCRVIVIDHEETASDLRGPASAGVGIVAFGPPQARYGVEQIAMRSACAAASLPSVIRRLMRGDLPTSLWWAEDLSHLAPAAPIVAMGRQLVYDSRQWRDIRGSVLALAPYIIACDTAPPSAHRTMTESQRVDLADVNWRRLMPVRRALVFAAGASGAAAWRPRDIQITHRPGDSALAWLLIGWLASRLDWPADAVPRIEEARRGDDVLSIVIGPAVAKGFGAAGGEAGETRATLDRGCVRVTHGGAAPSVVGVPREGEADAVAAELHALSHDACLHDALSALLRAFRAA
jgi:glucose-6-phosphate dehydrogenase assembly protein OpcA